MKSKLKPFMNNDWFAYSGVEGDNPFITYDEMITLDGTTYASVIVVSESGLNIDLWYIDHDQDFVCSWCYDTDQRTARLMVEDALAFDRLTTKGLLALGFYKAG